MSGSRALPDLATALGVQPEAEGRLQCLLCGRWLRSLGGHLSRRQGITAVDYRAWFELPASRALIASDLRERRVEAGRHG